MKVLNMDPVSQTGEETNDGDQLELPTDGFCLITAGAVASGKSTLQNALIHQLWTDSGIDLQFLYHDGSTRPDPALTEWINRFERGEFPTRTRKTRLSEIFNVAFKTKRGKVKLSFAEISGEHFHDLVVDTGGDEPEINLPRQIENMLTRKKLKKVFLFVSDVTRHQGARRVNVRDDMDRQAYFEDMMFSSLLERLHQLGERRLRLLFIISKWDLADNLHMPLKQYFVQCLPQTTAKLRKFHRPHVRQMAFSIGSIRAVEKGSHDEIGGNKIVDRKPVYIKRIINWIHFHATGGNIPGYPPMQMTWWERFKAWLS